MLNLFQKMGIVQKDAFKTMVISYIGIVLGYVNKGLLFIFLLSPEQIGIINLLLTLGVLFAQISNVGTVFTTWKFLPYFKNDKNQHYGFLPLMLLFVIVGISVCTIVAVIFRAEIQALYETKSAGFNAYYYWFLPIGIGYSIFMLLESYLRSFYKNIISAVAYELVIRLLILTILVFFAFGWINFDVFVLLHSFAYLVPMIILFFYLKSIGELNLSLSTINISKRFRNIILQFTSFNYLNTLGNVVVQSLDVIMIAWLVGLEGAGVYASIVFLTSALLVPYRSIVRISAPLVSDYWKHREFGKMKELYTNVSSVSLVIGLTSFSWLWMNIDFLFSFIPEDKLTAFTPGIWVFFFLMMGRLLDMFFGLNGSIFSTSKKFKYDIIFTLVLIVLVYGLNLLFIPYWGIIGAAISTGIALIVYNIARVIFVWKIFKIHPFTKNQFIIIGLGIVTILGWELISPLIENKWLHTIVATIFFLVVFIAPIFRFNLEIQIKQYITKGLKYIGL